MAKFDFEKRLTVRQGQAAEGGDSLAEDVSRGLTAKQKFLKPKYFYDEMGSIIFEAICRLPEYYVTRAELEILQKYRQQIIDSVLGPVSLVEAGSGSSTKTRLLIETILEQQEDLLYVPMDISEEILVKTADELLVSYPRLSITAFVGDYLNSFRLLNELKSQRKLVLFLGSSLGNFEPPEDVDFLKLVRSALKPGDGLLLGLDLKKSADILEPAYDDALHVTAAFNLNLLNRINRELDADFDLRKFYHRAIYNEKLGRIEMHLVSQCAQTAYLAKVDLHVNFDEGEFIHTESSYKYDAHQVHDLANKACFSGSHSWQDSNALFSLNMLVAK